MIGLQSGEVIRMIAAAINVDPQWFWHSLIASVHRCAGLAGESRGSGVSIADDTANNHSAEFENIRRLQALKTAT